MGRRKRKKVVYRPVKTLPKIFQCPSCGHKTMKTKISKQKKDEAIVLCGHCGHEQIVSANELTEPVDAFGEFIDIYFSEQEFERLSKRATKLEEKEQYSELASVYSYLADICYANSKEAMREYDKGKSESDLNNAQLWEGQAKEFEMKSQDIFQKLELKELEDGIDDENAVYEDVDEQEFISEIDPSTGKAKKGRDLDDILDDKGFLEF